MENSAWSLEDQKKRPTGLIIDKYLVEKQDQKDSYLFVLTKTNTRGKKFSPSTSIVSDAIANVYDPESGVYRNERIRYFAGCSTIFYSEQTRQERDKHTDPIVFHEGLKVVDKNNEALLQFLMLSPENDETKETRPANYTSAFKEWDGERQSRIANEKQDKITKARMRVIDATSAEIRALAYVVLSKKFTLSTLRQVDTESLRLELKQFAGSNPEPFLSPENNQKMLNAYKIYDAVEKGTLHLREDINTIYWSSTGEVFYKGPNGARVVDHLADLARIDSGLNDLIESAQQRTAPNREMDEKYDKIRKNEPIDMVDNMIDTLISKGHLHINDVGSYIKEVNFDGDKPRHWFGKRKMKEALEADQDLMAEMMKLALTSPREVEEGTE
jgi:hypothetical protein